VNAVLRKYITAAVICFVGTVVVTVALTGARSASGSGLPAAARAQTTVRQYARPPPLVPARGAYFGAWVKDPVRGWSPERVVAVERALGRKLAIDHRYYDFSDDFPYRAERWDLRNGRIPMLSWDPNGVTLDAINAGNYDHYIRERALALGKLRQPVFLRPMSEMNGDWSDWDGAHNNSPGKTDGPAKYVAAWRRLHRIFSSVGTRNVVWVWAPNHDSTPTNAWNSFRRYYPGGAYVDWVGIDGYNWGTTQSWSRWQSFAQLMRPVYAAYAPRKPIMVSETGSCEQGGSKAQWILAAAAAVEKTMRRIRALVWFDEAKECDWRISSSPSALAATRAVALRRIFNPRPPR
jgi:hypothetical protein